MAILRTSEIRTMTVEERADELETLRNELVRERALTSAGGGLLKIRDESEKSGEQLLG